MVAELVNDLLTRESFADRFEHLAPGVQLPGEVSLPRILFPKAAGVEVHEVADQDHAVAPGVDAMLHR